MASDIASKPEGVVWCMSGAKYKECVLLPPSIVNLFPFTRGTSHPTSLSRSNLKSPNMILALLLASLSLTLALPTLDHATSLTQVARRGDSSCSVISDGPGQAGYDAVGDMARAYIGERVCLTGADPCTSPSTRSLAFYSPDHTATYQNSPWCGVCNNAVIYLINRHSQDYEVCISPDDFNNAWVTVNPEGQTCVATMKDDAYLEIGYGNPTDFDNGGEQPCTNYC